MTDYRYRGVSLSSEDADAQLTLSYDHASGWYGGGAVTGVALDPSRQRRAQYLGYLGYAAPFAGLVWEAGATQAHVDSDSRYDYAEAYLGAIGERWNARVFFSPDYYGRGTRTAYADLNASAVLSPQWHLFGHAGALNRLSGNAPAGVGRTRYDAHLGIGLTLDIAELQLSWVGVSRNGSYPSARDQRRSTVVLSISHAF